MVFDRLTPEPPDPLLSAIGIFRTDPRAAKVDLGVGVYRAENGTTPVFRAVKAAEARLLQSQDSKAYVGPSGDLRFVEQIGRLVFGPGKGVPPVGLQTTGGTAALRLGFELLARAGVRTVHLGAPSWANHYPIIAAAGLAVRAHQHFDALRQRVAFDQVEGALRSAARGEAVLLQAACHNPTGADFTIDQWRSLAEIVSRRGLLPFIDLAYQGLGDGVDEDAAGARLVLEAAPEGLVAVSCSKSFGLYRERTGALFATVASDDLREAVESNLLAIARASYSMPPDHGAAVVRIILEDDSLRQSWLAELRAMRERINGLRSRLAAAGRVGGIEFAGLADQRGMFSLLPLSREQILWLREQRGFHMIESGRINLAGLRDADVDPLLQALAELAGRG